MRFEDPELLRQLGAEYVLGTLRGPARRRFERLVESRPEAREHVAFWESRLSEFGQILTPVMPPAAARAQVLRIAQPAPLPVVVPRAIPRTPPVRRSPMWMWPYAAGFATAATLALAFLVGQRNPVPAPPAAPTRADATEGDLPIYSARLQMPASSMQWLVSVSKDHRRLTVVAGDDFLQVGRNSVQLWGEAPGLAPVALGRLPSERDASASFDIPASLLGQPSVTFVISLESAKGSSPGKPSGPVLIQEPSLDQI